MPDPLLLGNAYPFRITVSNDAGVLVNPTTLDLTVTKPDGSTDVKHIADFTNSTVGTFDLDYLPATVGRYVWEDVTTTPNTASQGWFDVIAAGSGLTYLDADDLRNVLGGTENLAGTAAALSTADLTSAITQAQAEVDGRLAVRYDTPLADPPQLVVDITADIAAYTATLTYRRGEAIQSGEPIALRYARAQSLLAQAAAGTLALPVAQAPVGPGGAPAVTNPIDGDLWSPADFALTNTPGPFIPLPQREWQ